MYIKKIHKHKVFHMQICYTNGKTNLHIILLTFCKCYKKIKLKEYLIKIVI